MNWIESLERAAMPFVGKLTQDQCGKFTVYMELLLDWNTRMNLTALRTPEEIGVRHFEDSLSLLPILKPEYGATVMDVGSGAGFPAIPMAIVRPDLQITALDSLKKRVFFLEELTHRLALTVGLLHERAEAGGHQPALREQFDYVTARAVAPLHTLCEYCLPFVKAGGVFAAMKGPDVRGELEEATFAIAELGGKFESCPSFSLSDQSGRSIVIIKKISQTPSKYPRSGVKITKSHL